MFEKTFSFWRRLMGSSPTPKPQTGGPNEDRRLWVRYTTDLQGNIQLAEQRDEAPILAKIRDLSIGGANLQVDHAVEPGQMVSIELEADPKEVRTVLACVVRSDAEGNGKWSLGCVFSRELTSEDLDTLGAHKVEPPQDDQRTWVRYSCGLKANCRKVGDSLDISHPAEVLNISANGIGLAVSPSLHSGALLNVDLLDKEGRMVRTILACVVHTTQRAGGDYAVGCNFIRELSDEELRSLL